MSALVWHMAVLSSLLVGCAAYHPGSLIHGEIPGTGFTGRSATVGCLDIAVARRADYESSAVLQYRFGNRCNGPVEVDLGRIAVVARFADGSEERLVPYDPSMEIRPARISGRRSGWEAIAYPTSQKALQVCAELSAITPFAGAAARRPSAPPDPDAPTAPPQWLCFAAESSALAGGGNAPAAADESGAPADAASGDESGAPAADGAASGDESGAPATAADSGAPVTAGESGAPAAAGDDSGDGAPAAAGDDSGASAPDADGDESNDGAPAADRAAASTEVTP